MQIVACVTTDRDPIARGLARLLADTRALHAKTSRFCRDVAGPESVVLRPVLEQHCDELRLATDTIAERMGSRGVTVALPQDLAAPPAHQGPVWTVEEMIGCLAERHEMAARRAHDVLRLAEQAHDRATCDWLMQRIHAHEKTAWVLTAIGIAEWIRREL